MCICGVQGKQKGLIMSASNPEDGGMVRLDLFEHPKCPCGSFSTDEPETKLIYLAIRNFEKVGRNV